MAMIGLGAELTIGTFKCELRNVDGPGMDRTAVAVGHQTIEDKTKLYLAGLVDPGEASFEIIFDPSEALPLWDDPGAVVIKWPNGITWTWQNSFAKGFRASAPLEELCTGTLTVQLNGKYEIGGVP